MKKKVLNYVKKYVPEKLRKSFSNMFASDSD